MIPGRTGAAVDVLAGLPDPVVVVFGLLTQLADLWFFFGVLALAYLVGGREGLLDREDVVFLVAVALATVAVVQGSKALFALPRPPGAATAPEALLLPEVVRPLYREFALADGYGFPSGHATAATAMYGAAAIVVNHRSRALRAGSAAVLIAVVSLSRLVLGVHYLVDVLAGVVVGAAVLALVGAVGEWGDAPGRALTLVVGVALVPPLVAFTSETVATLGGAIGGRLTWGVVGRDVLSLRPDRTEAALATIVGLPVGGGLFAVAYTVEESVAVAFVANALVLAVILSAPLVARRALA